MFLSPFSVSLKSIIFLKINELFKSLKYEKITRDHQHLRKSSNIRGRTKTEFGGNRICRGRKQEQNYYYYYYSDLGKYIAHMKQKLDAIGLTGVAQLVGCPPAEQKVAVWIPGQGTGLRCGFGPQSGCIREAADRCFHVSFPFLLPPFPSL